jgi:UDP-N-acetylmuramoyl-tripeptide--D-alanyl-D-alanine ligase
MIPLSVSDIVAAVHGRPAGVALDLVVSDVTTDSRAVPAGSIFVALRGDQHDGHDHIRHALEAGAVAVLAERRIDDVPTVLVDDTWQAIADLAGHVRDRVDPLVVGITGSVGKTTTKDLTGAALSADRRTVAARGSFNNEVGVPLTLLRLVPDDRALVVEMGARGIGHIADLARYVKPDIGIVTAVAGVHLELFGTIDDITVAKGELVEGLPAGGAAVLNVDDARVASMAGRTAARVLRVSAVGAADADVVASAIALDELARPTFTAHTPWGNATARLSVAGRHQVDNALLALAAAGHAGVDIAAAAAALEAADISSWRGEIVEVAGARILNDAYNANPTSTRAALDTLVALEVPGRRFAVLGVMAEIGEAADEEHRGVGAYAHEVGIDRLVVVGEEAIGLADGARDAGMPAERIVVVDDADQAIAAIEDLTEGDALLVKASRVAALEAVAAAARKRLENLP